MSGAPEALFIDRYGRPPAVHAQAPGRVNLIGEHTDYNEGFVLPVATPQATHAWIAARPDRQVRVYSEAVAAEPPEAVYELGAETRTGRWIDYVAGVTAALGECGDHVSGFDAAITSTLPLGAGLASSAALQVALLRGLSELWHLGLNALEIARLAHRSETHFAGVPVGIMDQMAASLAAADAALFIDTRSLECEQLPLPRDTALIVIDSGIRHAHAAGEYRIRRAECQEAAQLLEVPTLRDAALERPEWPTLPDHLYRRARHVVTENNRVLQAVQALRENDPRTLGILMTASHASLRDDFNVSLPAIDQLVEWALAEPEIYGARLTGGGFGGQSSRWPAPSRCKRSPTASPHGTPQPSLTPPR